MNGGCTFGEGSRRKRKRIKSERGVTMHWERNLQETSRDGIEKEI
jgi:hypothetical protein